MKRIATLLGLVALAAGMAVALPAQAQAGVQTDIPDDARQIGPGVYDLGTERVDGRSLQKLAFVYRSHKDKHDPGGNGGGGGGGGSTQCYEFIGGEHQDGPEQYRFDETSSQDISDGQWLADTFAAQIANWEGNASTDAETDDMVGSEDTSTNTVSPGVGNDVNAVAFGSISDPGVIAVTYLWITKGKPSERKIYEWDQVYDQQDFTWNGKGSPASGEMDFRNIAAHELGHTMGLDHPGDGCSDETMYGTAVKGGTKKRTLASGDTNGIQALY